MKKMLVIAGLFALASCYSSNKPPYTRSEYDSMWTDLAIQRSKMEDRLMLQYTIDHKNDSPVKRFSTKFEEQLRDSNQYYIQKIDSIQSIEGKYYGKK
jgi:hypothetical protein